MPLSDIRFTDNSDEVKAELRKATARALEKAGLKAEGYAKKLCPVGTGRLRNSIEHKVTDDSVYIGSNVEYAPYVELGTGIHYPGGRRTPWMYEDAKGIWHKTSGSKAQPYLKPSVADHAAEYRGIIENELKNG